MLLSVNDVCIVNMSQCVHTSVVQQLLQALGVQQVPQPAHLGLQLSDQLGVGIFVDHGVAADLLGAVGVPVMTSARVR